MLIIPKILIVSYNWSFFSFFIITEYIFSNVHLFTKI